MALRNHGTILQLLNACYRSLCLTVGVADLLYSTLSSEVLCKGCTSYYPAHVYGNHLDMAVISMSRITIVDWKCGNVKMRVEPRQRFLMEVIIQGMQCSEKPVVASQERRRALPLRFPQVLLSGALRQTRPSRSSSSAWKCRPFPFKTYPIRFTWLYKAKIYQQKTF